MMEPDPAPPVALLFVSERIRKAAEAAAREEKRAMSVTPLREAAGQSKDPRLEYFYALPEHTKLMGEPLCVVEYNTDARSWVVSKEILANHKPHPCLRVKQCTRPECPYRFVPDVCCPQMIRHGRCDRVQQKDKQGKPTCVFPLHVVLTVQKYDAISNEPLFFLRQVIDPINAPLVHRPETLRAKTFQSKRLQHTNKVRAQEKRAADVATLTAARMQIESNLAFAQEHTESYVKKTRAEYGKVPANQRLPFSMPGAYTTMLVQNEVDKQRLDDLSRRVNNAPRNDPLQAHIREEAKAAKARSPARGQSNARS